MLMWLSRNMFNGQGLKRTSDTDTCWLIAVFQLFEVKTYKRQQLTSNTSLWAIVRMTTPLTLCFRLVTMPWGSVMNVVFVECTVCCLVFYGQNVVGSFNYFTLLSVILYKWTLHRYKSDFWGLFCFENIPNIFLSTERIVISQSPITLDLLFSRVLFHNPCMTDRMFVLHAQIDIW